MRLNPNKTVCANSKGIIISFRDANKHKFIPYENNMLDEIQTSGHKKYQNLETPVFNKMQQQLYAEVVYGLNYYSKDDIDLMPKPKKSFILARYIKAQRILNKWKQEIVHEKVDNLLMTIFPDSVITKILVQTKGYDRSFKETHSFKELGLTQRDVADKLIEVNILPKNFYQLT